MPRKSPPTNAAEKTVDLNDIHGDVTHMSHLLDVIVEELVGMPDATRALERVSALAWIARDLAEQLDATIEGAFWEISKSIPSQSAPADI